MNYILSILLIWMTFLYVYSLFKNKIKQINEQGKVSNSPLRENIILSLRDSIKKYVQHEAEHGILLPQDFKTDPAAWLNVLRSIEYAFDELYLEYEGEKVSCETNQEAMIKRREKIQKGLELFGKYLVDLN